MQNKIDGRRSCCWQLSFPSYLCKCYMFCKHFRSLALRSLLRPHCAMGRATAGRAPPGGQQGSKAYCIDTAASRGS